MVGKPGSASKANSSSAGSKSSGTGKSGGRGKKRTIPQHNLNQLYTKIVTSETCVVCKKQCARGIDYMKRMEQPGAVGNGVPCILTGYKLHS